MMESGAPSVSDPEPTARFLATIAAGIDSLALAGARLLIDSTVMPRPEELDDLVSSGEFYRRPEFQEQPRRFFAFLDEPLEVPAVSVSYKRPRARGSERLALEFRSAYEPVHPDHRRVYAAETENHVAVAELWRHRGGRGRGTLIGMHGFGMGNPAIDAPALMASHFFELGLDVALFTLPLHGQRKPRASRFSGALFTRPDVTRMNETIGQAVHDLALLISWLRSHSDRPVGLVGLSLGGYVAALMAALMDDLDFVVPMVAPVCFGDLAFRFMSASRHYRRQPDAVLDHTEFREAYRIHSPLTHAPRLPRERLMIVAGRGDRIVPSEHPVWLWHHWDRPRIHWFNGSHVVPFGRRRIARSIGHFLHELEIV